MELQESNGHSYSQESLMRTITFKLNDQEQQIVDAVTKNTRYRHFKDPKRVYMDAAMEALKALSK